MGGGDKEAKKLSERGNNEIKTGADRNRFDLTQAQAEDFYLPRASNKDRQIARLKILKFFIEGDHLFRTDYLGRGGWLNRLGGKMSFWFGT